MKTENNKLTFGELKIGDWFISFPLDGDNSGHGGYKRPYYIFVKVPRQPEKFPGVADNAYNLMHCNFSSFTDSIPVLPLDCAFAKMLREKLDQDPQSVLQRMLEQ